MKYIYDMGFAEFEKREELRYSLAYSVARGLIKAGSERGLLCDYSGGNVEYTGTRLLAESIAASRRVRDYASPRGEKRIGIAIPPSHPAMISNYACLFAGIIPVNLNFTHGRLAAQSCLRTADIKTVVSIAKWREKMEKTDTDPIWERNLFDAGDVLAGIPKEEIEEIENDAKTLEADSFAKKYGIEKFGDNSREATLVFTSGSEGNPKAAVLSERNIIANCTQIKLSGLLDEKTDVLLANLPIFHSFGMLFEVWYMTIYSQRTVTLYNPLEVKENIRAIYEKKATAMIGTPTFLRAYLRHAKPEHLASLKAVVVGAEKTPKGFDDLWNNTFGDSYREGYGLTEASPIVGVSLPNKDYGWYTTGIRKGSIGKIMPGMMACTLKLDTLEMLPLGSEGLLAVKGANVFGGYLDNPKATAKAFKDGWLVTGDISRIDEDGFVFIEGRLARFSKIGGEMVPHATVESALYRELGFDPSGELKIAISSRLDEGKGEALVLLSTVDDVTLAQAKKCLRKAGISNLWHPKYLVRVDKIPILGSGKLDLKNLSELAKAK